MPASKEYMEEYRIKNKERIRERQRAYEKTQKSKAARRRYQQTLKYKAMHKNWKQSEKGKACSKAYRHNRRINEIGLTPEIISQVYLENLKRFNILTCYLCLKPIPANKDHLEHKTPLTRGGNNEKNNLGVACEYCNCKKHNKTEDEYRKECENARNPYRSIHEVHV